MKIHHIAIWSKDLEKMKAFYTKYFDCISGPKYTNRQKQFNSYFLSFKDGTKIELMSIPSLHESTFPAEKQYTGWAHIAISAGGRDAVNHLTNRLAQDGYSILSRPRETGDGYYESVILDPENNRIEITI